MELEFLHEGKKHHVKIERVRGANGNPLDLKVSIGEREYNLNAARISPHCYSIILDDRNLIACAAESDDSVYIHIDSFVVRLEKVNDDQKDFSGESVSFGTRDEVSTPMPGKVVKILVKEGDNIEVGQPLVIVESMKMENEIRSPTDGEVKSVNFSAGDLVEPGQAIIKLLPAD